MEELKIKRKVEDMMTWSYSVLRNFPKSEKHVLSAEIRQSMLRLLRDIIIVNRRYYKKTTLQDLDAELDLLRSLVSLAHHPDLAFISRRQYEIWSGHLAEIGKMVGGWMAWAKQG